MFGPEFFKSLTSLPIESLSQHADIAPLDPYRKSLYKAETIASKSDGMDASVAQSWHSEHSGFEDCQMVCVFPWICDYVCLDPVCAMGL